MSERPHAAAEGAAPDPAPPPRPIVTCGPLRIGLNLTSGELARARWVDRAGAPADVEVALAGPGQGPPPSVRAPDALRYDGKYVRGWVGPGGEGAAFVARLPPEAGPFGPGTAYHCVKEAAFAVGLEAVTRRGGLMLHACTLRIGGRAWVVCGRSGAGKTTLYERFDRGRLGDEWGVVVPEPGGGWASWSWTQWRERSAGEPTVVPLGGLLALGPGRDRTAAEPASRAEGAAALTISAYWLPWHDRQLLLDLALRLLADHPVRWLQHSLDTPLPELRAVITGEGCANDHQ